KTLLDMVRCAASGQPVRIEGNGLVTADGSTNYAVIDGIPILLLESAESTHQGYDALLLENRDRAMRARDYGEEDATKFLDGMLVPTCGNLFHGVHLSEDYPIPDFPQFSKDSAVLDVGGPIEGIRLASGQWIGN